MGDNKKLVAIALFAITTRKKKCDDNTLVAITFFISSKKNENLGDGNKLVAIALIATKNKRKKKNCRHLLCFKQKQINEKKNG